MSDNVRYLSQHRVPGQRARVKQPSGPSLDFALMAATKHAENGDHNAAWTALLDALWIMHRGNHETLGDDRIRQHMRALGGHEYLPPDAA